ncbi:hypothetical protein PpBr36_06821, partial [Pyricularia pennisetigena]|uniref:hypothetical protein n=1 Tax=Pyricularia pennisetigena TaxID=1578925 RepID=UPI00115175C8
SAIFILDNTPPDSAFESADEDTTENLITDVPAAQVSEHNCKDYTRNPPKIFIVGEKVDYCVIVNGVSAFDQRHMEAINTNGPEKTPAQVIDILHRRTAGTSINHTDFGALNKWPIAMSVETKRPGESGEKAELQMGVWQAVSWPGPASPSVLSSPSQISIPPSIIPGLVFLPALVIVGHDWRLAATTLEDCDGGRTVLWTESTIGSTSNLLGIYRIIWCVRRLVRYFEEILAVVH